ncbi:MAG: hypothetical protein U0842_15145 [Candidatus Binatia bacterium]
MTSMPGIRSVICAPGLKPSLWFHSLVDVHAARVGRHRLAHERDAPSGVGRGVLARQRVARERQQALVGIEDLAALRVRRVHGDRCRAGRSAVAAAAEGEGEGHGHRERYEPVAEAAARAKDDAGERFTRGNF